MTEDETTKSYFTLDRNPRQVDLNDLILKSCQEIPNKVAALHSLINYLQSDMERIILSAKESCSFWYNLDAIITFWQKGNVQVAIDSLNNIYGYLVGNNSSPLNSNEIIILEVLPCYRGKGVGKFMVQSWEKLRSLHKEGYLGEYVFIEPVKSSAGFWFKMGYITHDINTMKKKITKSI